MSRSAALLSCVVLLIVGCSDSGSSIPFEGGSAGAPPIAAGGGGDGSVAPGAGASGSGGLSSMSNGVGGGSTSSTGGGPGVADPGAMASDARVYTAQGTEFTIDEIGEALAEITSGGPDNVILYIHGRGCGGGGEPQKSLDGAMQDLEADYSSKALMFNWPGSDVGCPLGFPEDQARASGPAFAHTLHKLAYYRATHPEGFAGLKLVLIAHSMGSLVLEQSLSDDPMPFPATALFDTLVVGSSASARGGHDEWLMEVAYSPNIYVSLNNGDNVLTAAGSAPGGTRLGKNVDGAKLAANALYVDFSAASVNHAYYLHSGQDGQHMTEFYDAVMNGIPYDFGSSSAIESVEERDGTFIYTFDGQ